MKIKDTSFFRSLRGALTLSMALVLCAMATVLLYYIFGVAHAARQQAEESVQLMSETACARIEYILNTSQEAAQMISYSNSVQKYLLSDLPSTVINARSEAQDTLTYADLFGEGYADIMLLSKNGRKLSSTNNYEEVMRVALATGDVGDEMIFRKPFFSDVVTADGKDYVVYLSPVYGNIDGYRFRDNAIVCGIIYNLNDLIKELSQIGPEDGIAILYRNGQALESSRTLSNEEKEILSELNMGQETKLIGMTRYFASRTSIPDTDWELIYLVPEKSVTASFDQMRSGLVMLIMGFILLVAILMLGILLAIRRDISGLTGDIRQLRIEEDQTVRTPRIAELQPVSAAINQTMEQLHQSIRREQKLTADSYEARQAQTRSEMLAYRSQINPHFLFNTMESIRSMAHHYHAEPVEQLVGGMSQMFRYALYSPMIVPLEEELGHLGSYFSVMCTRFPGKYRILESIAPETLSWPTLSMILQPLAENALLHAFTGRKSGILLIQTFIRNGKLIVRIADNGIGIPEELLHTIQDKMKHSSDETAHIKGHSDHGKDYKSSIGLPNIYRRLKLTFGEEASLALRSKEYYYTVAELQIPPQKTQ